MRTKKDGTIIWSNLSFNPTTGLGHSYGWYEIAKRTHGIQLLNTYSYNSSTIRRVGKMRSLLGDYVAIEAPRGLQDLKEAFSFCVAQRNAIEEIMISKKRKDTHVYAQLERARNKYSDMIDVLVQVLPSKQGV